MQPTQEAVAAEDSRV